MVRFKMAVIDFDRTLGSPRWRPHVSPENIAAVSRLHQAGIHPVLVSGRPYRDLLHIHRQTLGLGGEGPIIGCQGAIAIDSNGERIISKTLGRDVIPSILDESKTLQATALYFADDVYVAERDVGRWTELYNENAWRPLTVVESLLELAEPPQKIILMREPEFIAGAISGVQSRFSTLDLMHTDPENLEFMVRGVHKATAMAQLAARHDVSANEIVAFGDGRNDEEVMEWVGLGVAMDHAAERTKVKAKLVGPPGREETAFARAVELFFHSHVRTHGAE